MKGSRSLLKKILLIDIVIVIYIILTSSIIDYRSETKVAGIFVDSILKWSEEQHGEFRQVIERETKLSVKPDEELFLRLKGEILLQVESVGEAWWLNPDDKKRYFLGRPGDTWRTIQNKGIKIASDELVQYLYFDKSFPLITAGRFVINEDDLTDVYYVLPKSLKGIKLNSAQEAWEVMKEQGMGISNENIRKLSVAQIYDK
ncbi:hypothetical protein KAR28_01135 [Candidatus Parcubacteria bacterium]|nr:hypothetical protein [Candidatus Parcubacteria bacterium]